MTGDPDRVAKALEDISNPIVVTGKRSPLVIRILIALAGILLLLLVLSYASYQMKAVGNTRDQITVLGQQLERQQAINDCVSNVQVKSQALLNDLLLSFQNGNGSPSDEIAAKLMILTRANSNFPVEVAACQAAQ